MGNEIVCKHITVEEFSKLDPGAVTLVDMREPDEVLIGEIEDAINIPFSGGFSGLDEIPKDKPVVVICRKGNLSEEVAEILSDRGYDAASLDGGYLAYREFLKEETKKVPAESSKGGRGKVIAKSDGREKMSAGNPAETSADGKKEASSGHAVKEEAGWPLSEKEGGNPVLVDAKNLKCPGPIVKVADYLRDKPAGTRILAEATEDAFASDIRVWCERTGNVLDDLTIENGIIKAQITRAEKQETPSAASDKNGKTFVVFSGDLDKTIAAFIMANGAAAMGRKVTMFFTFWGLNILRRPKKVRVKKTFIEKMFGSMMPRGSAKLGLSRMNMGGAGAKMIRGIMKKKGISSLEELISSAVNHGVRLVACQMSMDIMGISREELIDGIELGGVSTFLGSGEESDMSLFI